MNMKMWASQETVVKNLITKILRTDAGRISTPNENEKLLLAICINSFTNKDPLANEILKNPKIQLSSFELMRLALDAKDYLDNQETA